MSKYANTLDELVAMQEQTRAAAIEVGAWLSEKDYLIKVDLGWQLRVIPGADNFIAAMKTVQPEMVYEFAKYFNSAEHLQKIEADAKVMARQLEGEYLGQFQRDLETSIGIIEWFGMFDDELYWLRYNFNDDTTEYQTLYMIEWYPVLKTLVQSIKDRFKEILEVQTSQGATHAR